MRICSVDGCDKDVDSHGFCSAHAHRYRRYGDPLTRIETTRDSNVFIKRLLVTTTNTCVIWPYSRGKDGRGQVTVRGVNHKAARYICRLAHGEPPTPKHEAAHSCGKGHEGCVNPLHLSWKTRKENEQDKWVHGTRLFGSACPQARLTEDLVSEIRSLGGVMYHKDIAARYGISRRYVGQILSGEVWKHVT